MWARRPPLVGRQPPSHDPRVGAQMVGFMREASSLGRFALVFIGPTVRAELRRCPVEEEY